MGTSLAKMRIADADHRAQRRRIGRRPLLRAKHDDAFPQIVPEHRTAGQIRGNPAERSLAHGPDPGMMGPGPVIAGCVMKQTPLVSCAAVEPHAARILVCGRAKNAAPTSSRRLRQAISRGRPFASRRSSRTANAAAGRFARSEAFAGKGQACMAR